MIQHAYQEFVIRQLDDWRTEGWDVCLVTVVQIDGGSPRPLGSQMAVRADGLTIGLVTGGCAEKAIVGEAQLALREGAVRQTRFGAGSPYVDVRLPCGTGLDLRFDPNPDQALIRQILTERKARRPITLVMERPAGVLSLAEGLPYGSRPCHSDSQALIRPYTAPVRLVLAGRGPLTDVLARLALDTGIEVFVQTPDEDVAAALTDTGAEIAALTSPADFDHGLLDAATALVLLFHDHEWEPDILTHALASEAFYIGALGSRSTHAQRLEILRSNGVSDEGVERIRGPVGLTIGAEGPIEIAVSVLGDVIAARRQAGLAPL